jgi:hypothetical protein
LEIRYQLHKADLETLRQHLSARLRERTGGIGRHLKIGAISGVLTFLVLRWYEREDDSWYQDLIWLLPLAMFVVSVIWQQFWYRSKYRLRWLEQFTGKYLLNLAPAGISYLAPDGRMSFYAWPEIQGFETTDAELYLYLRHDVAIPIPRSALGDDVDTFAEKVRDLWSGHPENVGKILPATPSPGNLISPLALVANLRQGARVVFFIGFDAQAFRVSFGLFMQLLLLNLLCLGAVDYIDAQPAPEFSLYGLAKFGVATLLMLGGAASISNFLMQRAHLLRLLVMISASEIIIRLIYFSSWLAVERWWPDDPALLWALFIANTAWTLAMVFRIVLHSYRQPAPSALLLVSIYAFFTLALTGSLPSERLYYSAQADNETAEHKAAKTLDVEDAFYRQPTLVANELATLQPQRSGKTDLYFVGFAGQAEERVFFNEVSFARNLLDSRFNSAGHSLVLLNNTDTVQNAPLANRHNLEAVLQGIGQRMDSQEDILFLFLSSHGAKDQKLSVSFWPFRLNDLKAEELKAMLDNAGIRNRVIVVSACYSGGFLDVLQDDNTLVLTASSRDHVSYGCGDFTQYTYFGESFFVKALASGDSFITAFEQARDLIQQREKSEGLDASGPQIAVGRNIAQLLQKLEVVPVQQDLIDAGLSFEERVRQARDFEQDAAARDYAGKNLYPAMATIMSASMKDCLKQPDASTEKFTLVANILRNGEIGDVDYKPATNTAQCFGESMRSLHLPSLPEEFPTLPVFFDMKIAG